jgi:hypothetical protein
LIERNENQGVKDQQGYGNPTNHANLSSKINEKCRMENANCKMEKKKDESTPGRLNRFWWVL